MREQEMQREQIPARPPRIPNVPHQSELPTFGGENARFDGASVMSDRAAGPYSHRLAQKSSLEKVGSSNTYRGMPIPPVPPIPAALGHSPSVNQAHFDPSRAESMTHRGRYSYASSAISTINSPRKIRRRKDPTPFKYTYHYLRALCTYIADLIDSILVLGARGSGKTSFLNFLLTSLALPSWKHRPHAREDDYLDPPPPSEASFPKFKSHYVETEEGSERIGVTLWDSEGLERSMVDLQLKETTTFIESKFEDTYTEESKVARAPNFQDTHIHCVFLVLDPLRLDTNIAAIQKANTINSVKAQANSFVGNRPEPVPTGLDENLDLNVLRALKGRTTVVPVLSKADTVSSAHMAHLKRAVWESLKTNNLDKLDALSQDYDDGSDTSTEEERGRGRNDLDERDEDDADAEEDKFSVTSHLDDASSSSSSFATDDFDLAKTRKPSKTSANAASPLAPAPPVEPPPFPLSIISPDPYEPETVGRRFPWGLADPYNAEHCDFTRLKKMVFTEWRADLREASRELWYEGWRTSRLNRKNKRNGFASLGLNTNEMRDNAWAGQSGG